MKQEHKRILLVSTTSVAYSGATWSLIGLAKSLKNDGYNVTVLFPKRGTAEKLCADNGIDYDVIKHYIDGWIREINEDRSGLRFRLKSSLKRILNVFAEYRIRYYIKNKRFDIVHVNSLTDCIVAKGAFYNNIPVVWHIREFLEEDLNKTFCNNKSAYRIISSSKCAIAISNSVKEKFSKLIDTPIIVVYNGIDVNRFFFERRILNENRITISIVGRIAEGKGQDQLVKAIVLLVKEEKINNIHVRIIGKPQYPQYIDQLKEIIVSNGCQDIFEFIEHTNEIEKYYSTSDIMCVCSKKEAFGRVTIEGMCSGLLVIGSNTGGTPELIKDGETGYLYEEGNIISLASVIKKAIYNVEVSNTIAQNGQQWAFNTFTVEHNAREIEKIYQRL